MIYLNNEPLPVTIFPDNTSQVWKINLPKRTCEIRWEFEYEQEFMHLAQLKDLLDYYYISSTLYLDYVPYARQDKPISNETTFSLSTFSKLLNGLNFKNIFVKDIHSEKSYIINNINNHIQRIDVLCKKLMVDGICFPDHSAYEKYIHYSPRNLTTVVADKKRDCLTGDIIEHSIRGVVTKNIIIRDDICDGGKTFISVAKLLQEKGAIEINIYVTHGIFSKGLQVLRDAGIKRIFTHKGEAFEHRDTKQIYYKEII